MNLKEFQAKAVGLLDEIDSSFPEKKVHDVETTFIHLIEEIGEIARQFFNKKSGRDELDKENVAEEIADCYIILAKLAEQFDIDISESVDRKMIKLKERFKV